MAIKIKFDSAHSPQTPTIVLARRNGSKIGVIPYSNLRFQDNFNSNNNIDFKVLKAINGINYSLWDEIKDFRLVWVKEWDAWFEITVEIDEGNELIKSVNGLSLGEAELSFINLYNVYINTEEDIALDDYIPTSLYNPFKTRGSLLHRILEKAPHYTIKHVDSSIMDIQRTFSFDSISIYDAFQEIAEEIECLFIISQHTDSETGKPERGIYVYDLLDFCNNCGNRGNFTNNVCTDCGSSNIKKGYGDDTSIFISSENLSNNINFTTSTDSVFNCFRLSAGDDLMTATIMSLNPNGSEYIWYISDEQKSDMPTNLVNKIESYDELYNYYQNDYICEISTQSISDYNTLVEKYENYNPELNTISNSIIGYTSLIDVVYNTIDMELYLTNSLMPTVEMSETSAQDECALLTSSSMSPLAVTNLSVASASTVDLNVLSMAKAIVNSNYQVKIKSSTYNSSSHVWKGIMTITNYSDEQDTADTSSITLQITDNYEKYIKQKIEKILYDKKSDDYDVLSLFEKELSPFSNELKKYALNPLKGFHDNCQSCLDILVEEGISDANSWDGQSTNLYNNFYNDYYQKMQAIESEIAVREREISIVKQLGDNADNARLYIQKSLNFKDYLGEDLWKDFCAYRRESDYQNTNYISDGLNNAEIIQNARDFIKIAKKELIKSATLQHSISSSLNNLLVIRGFDKILDYFQVGNWLRIRINEGIYKLRLISYTIDFDNLENIDVDFSDVINIKDEVSDIESLLKQAESMASSYNFVERQSNEGAKSNKVINTWFEDGLNASLTKIINSAFGQNMTFDEHGLLMRQYDASSDSYSKEQLKIINSTLAITDDNWKTTKTAIGKFYYKNPITGNLEIAYGINGETIVGKMILGSTLSLYNSSGTLTFNDNGLSVTNNINTFSVNPNNTELFKIQKNNTSILSLFLS